MKLGDWNVHLKRNHLHLLGRFIRPCCETERKGMAPAICTLLEQVGLLVSVNWKVTVWGSSLILTLLQNTEGKKKQNTLDNIILLS